jgi:uncharacterized membrane protein
MLPNPLHPAVVHFPIVLAAFFPLVVGVIFYLVFRDNARIKLWRVALVYALLMAVSARVAVSTGETQEDVVEEIVDHDVIEGHEERAETLAITSIVTLLVASLGLAAGKPGMIGRTLAVVGAIVLSFQAITVGKTGGELVYVHGAASAYVDSGAMSVDGPERGEGAEDHDDDDDDDDDD